MLMCNFRDYYSVNFVDVEGGFWFDKDLGNTTVVMLVFNQIQKYIRL